MPVDIDAPNHGWPDEEDEICDIGTYGWEQTNEEHGYCTFCGHYREHITADCPYKPVTIQEEEEESHEQEDV